MSAKKSSSRTQPKASVPVEAGPPAMIPSPDAAAPSAPAAAPKKTAALPAAVPGAAFPVVVIGGSAGGLEALRAFLENTAPSHIAYIVILHRSRDDTRQLLINLLSRNTSLEVLSAEDGMALAPDKVFVIPPGEQYGVEGRTLRRVDGAEEPRGVRLPIDALLRSLGTDLGEMSGCVILSGADSDGTLGAGAVKEAGGLVVAQDPVTAEYQTMPASLVDSGVADLVLPPRDMPAAIAEYFGHHLGTDVGQLQSISQHDLNEIFTLLKSRTGHNFANYKHSTIIRRIRRRMDIAKVNSVTAYIDRLKTVAEEPIGLFRDLLIGVTNFFRDPEAFDALKQALKGDYLPKVQDREYLRVWVAGCSTGEEAYSVAIILKEAVEESDQSFKIQIYGTDLDHEAIERARNGTYPESIAQDITPARLKRFFVKSGIGYQVKKEIREMVIFAVQNLAQDPPFSRLDLVCCRNLLIYLNSRVQKKVLATFHYALKDGGILFLGTSESVDALTNLFEERNKKWRIFQRKAGSYALAMHGEPLAFPSLSGPSTAGRGQDRLDRGNLRQTAERFLLDSCTPPSALVNNFGDILYIHGRTGNYLEPSPGEPAYNILSMARDGLRLELAGAIATAASHREDVVRRNIVVRTNGDSETIDLHVRFLKSTDSGHVYLMVSFVKVEPQTAVALPASSEHPQQEARKRIDELERELQYTRENMQTMAEEYESANEELQSTNEELETDQRGAAVDQRGAGDGQRGAAVHQRGADHPQRRAQVQDQRAGPR